MSAQNDKNAVGRKQREQMLRLVAKGFYNELINYGVQRDEILKVASHLLDNLMTRDKTLSQGIDYYNRLFDLTTVKDEWAANRQLTLQHVVLRPLQAAVIQRMVEWVKSPAVRESFVPAFPADEAGLTEYFAQPGREYFGIYYNEQPVGLIGGENIDAGAGKLEMKKLVGESGLQGKGIGKRATFGFLYYTFLVLNLNKVYIHSRDINMHNINLNSRFGFELEGVFFEDLKVGEKRQDIVRMALFKSRWEEIFSRPRSPA